MTIGPTVFLKFCKQHIWMYMYTKFERNGTVQTTKVEPLLRQLSHAHWQVTSASERQDWWFRNGTGQTV